MKHIVFIIQILLPMLMFGAESMPYRFESITPNTGLADPKIFCFEQDNLGYMWIGTNGGLNRFDGYRLKTYTYRNNNTSLSNSRINCLFVNGDSLFIGTDKGIEIFNINTEVISKLNIAGDLSVKFILKDNNGCIWFGTNAGIISYNDKKIVTHYSRTSTKQNFPGDYVPCGVIIDNTLYVGTHDFLCKLTPDNSFESIPIPFGSKTKNNLLLSLIEDTEHAECIYIGTERGLISFNLRTSAATLSLENIPVKTLTYDALGNLWIGTDNGLYVKQLGSDNFICKKYDTNDTHSIQSDVVWSIFNDKDNNMWLGTDNGISIMPAKKNYNLVTIKDITGLNEGNLLFTIYHDRRNNLWLGGSNGLIRQNLNDHSCEWFKSGRKSLSHNKIRYLYEDDNSLWIASDGGLNRYDYNTKKIIQYTIKDKDGIFNPNWMYAIVEDHQGNLWLGTYEGGIFIVSKNELINNTGEEIIASGLLNTQTKENALSSNIINSEAIDGQNIWIGTDNTGIHRFDLKNNELITIDESNSDIVSNFVKAIATDENKRIWIGTNNGLCLMTPPYNSVTTVAPEKISGSIRFLAIQNENIWIPSLSGISCYNHETNDLKSVYLGNNYPTCATYYAPEEMMFVGTSNGYIEFSPKELLHQPNAPKLCITELLLENKPIEIGQDYDGHILLNESLQNQKKVKLGYRQNSFDVEFSAFLYTNVPIRYAYRLKGFDDSWRELPGISNRASYINVPPGKYIFEVCTINNSGSISDNITNFEIHIIPPWYRSILAYIAYLFAIAGIVTWMVVRSHLRHIAAIEKVKREKTLNVARMKLDFFANISHEFKTPLSLILGYIGSLVVHESNNDRKQQLLIVQKNAEKLHLLINQMLNTKESSSEENNLMLSETLLPDFIHDIFSQFTESFERKSITAKFVCDEITNTFYIDRVKIESVITNLLSNALKFVDKGGCITVSISKKTNKNGNVEAVITVSDNGCGITNEDLPKVFDRYFISQSSQHLNKEGCGIGLSISKQIVEQHNGTISVTSEKGKGTSVSFSLKASEKRSFVKKEIQSEITDHLDSRPLVLVVEDNEEICDFITSSLKEHFDFVTAADGKQGFSKVLECQPNIVITDLMMPVMNGEEFCKTVRNNIKTATIPIIILTAKTDSETEISSYEYADAYITKPFDINYLYSICLKLIKKSQKMAEKARITNLTRPQDEAITSPDDLFLKQITEALESSLSDPDMNVSSLCQKCGMNDKQMYRKIKQLTGMSIVEYIRGIRLKKAAMFLKQNKLSVSEIMYLVGFSNASYFTKCFKEEYGVSPKEFAKQTDYKDITSK